MRTNDQGLQAGFIEIRGTDSGAPAGATVPEGDDSKMSARRVVCERPGDGTSGPEATSSQGDSTCEDGDHDWEHIADWYGDPGVIHGTCSLYYKRCRVCGKEEDDSDYDGGSDFDEC